ncbi:MAG: hypothetical protein ACKPKO_23260, partial [Candidatus Fonsibacter sp.]
SVTTFARYGKLPWTAVSKLAARLDVGHDLRFGFVLVTARASSGRPMSLCHQLSERTVFF